MDDQVIRKKRNRRFFVLGLMVLVVVSVWDALLPVQAAQQATSTPRKRALLIGISKYPQTGPNPWRPLNTHQDVVLLKDALAVHGFATDDVMVLEDGDATADGIRTAFRKHLIEQAKPGDTLFFHFSGHGQQVPDDNGDEIDGLDETLVPANATDQRATEGAKTNLRDDEIGIWLKTLADKLRGPDGKLRGSVTVSLDSCFSGTATRGELVERGHGWDEAIDGPKPPIKSANRGTELAGSLQDIDCEVQFLSAALSTQTAKERNGMGVFSRSLIRALSRADNQTNYRALLDDILYEVAQSGVRDQTPGLEGNGDLLLFRGEARKHERTTRVVAVDGDTITIAAGQLHLVTVGSIYAVHRAGNDPLSEENKLGEADVIAVDAAQSVLKLRTGPKLPRDATAPTVLLRARVVETAHRFADSPLRVRLSGVPSELENALKVSPVLTVKNSTDPQYDVELRAEQGLIGLYRPESKDRFAKVPFGPTAVATLDLLLRAEWRWRSLASLRIEDAAAQVKLRIVPVQCPTGSPPKGQLLTERTDVPKAEPLRLRAEDCFQLELHNPTANKLWATVLQLSPDGSIEPAFPHPRRFGEHLIPPNQKKRIPTPYVYKVELSAEHKHERSTFKVFATTEPLDLSPLIQQAYDLSRIPAQDRGPARAELDQKRASVPSKLGPLSQLLIETTLGERKGTMLPTSLDAWGVTTTALDQDAKP